MDCTNHDYYFTRQCIEFRELESIRKKSDAPTIIIMFIIIMTSFIYSLLNFN